MELAVMVDGQEGVTWQRWRSIAQHCEKGGFSALFAADHYSSLYDAEREALDAWSMVTGLAALTERIHLGVLVSPPTFRHPSVLSRVAVTADHISQGRVELAMGVGWNEPEHRRMGIPFYDAKTRADLLSEQLEIITRQWAGESFDFEGSHYQLEECVARPTPYGRPRIPIMLGGSARRRTAQLAARFADEYNTTFGATPEVCTARRRTLDQACARVGRDPATLRLSVMLELVVAPSQAEVDRLLETIAERQGLSGPREFLDTDEVGGTSMLVGTPDTVLRRLREYAAIGVDRVVLQHLLDDHDEMLDLVAGEILPAI